MVDRPCGAEPRSMVDRARARQAPAGGAPRRGGDSRREKARQGHQRVRLGEANAMEGSPSRNVDGKEKLDDGGDADFDEFGGGAAEFGELAARASRDACGEGRSYLKVRASLGLRTARKPRGGAAAPSVSDGRLGAALTGGAHPSAGGGRSRAAGAAALRLLGWSAGGAAWPTRARGERGRRGALGREPAQVRALPFF